MHITEVTALPEGFERQARALYERSFPPAELNDWDEIMDALGDPDAPGSPRLIIATTGDRLVGLSLFKYFEEAEIGYLWYICVDESTRGSGVGTRLYKASVEAMVSGAHGSGRRIKGMIFEVERLDSESHPIFGDPIRRVRFYERLGARLIMGYDYWQPAKPPYEAVPLQLMFHPMDLPESECTGLELAPIVTDFLHFGQSTEVTVDPTGLRLENR